MVEDATTGLTKTGYRLVPAITALSVAHHVDHILRDVTGWPLASGFNAFSASLFVYPVILAGVLLSGRHRVGARSWAMLAGGAALFILAVHVGPAAGDSVTTIPDQYGSNIAAVTALALLGLFLAALIWHCGHEIGRLTPRAQVPSARRSVLGPLQHGASLGTVGVPLLTETGSPPLPACW